MSKILPFVTGVELLTEHSNKKYWSKEFNVFLADKNNVAGLFKRRYKEIGENITLVVCSPYYAENNIDHWDSDKVNTFLIQKHFDIDYVRHYVNSIIEQIGEVDIDVLYSKLARSFILDDDEWS